MKNEGNAVRNFGVASGRYAELYSEKLCTVEEALAKIQSGDRIIVSQAAAEPADLLSRLHSVADRGVEDLEVQTSLVLGEYPFLSDPRYRDVIDNHCWFFTEPTRRAQEMGLVTPTPQHVHRGVVKKLSHPRQRRLILLCTCSPMDRHGYFSLSISNIYEHDFVRAGAKIICEVNPNYPRTFGDNLIHLRDVEAIVHSERQIPEIERSDYTQIDDRIASHIAELVEDGATLQLGIGKIPNAVAARLRGKMHLGIHTEMFTENMYDLIECGAVDNRCKGLYDGFSVCTFAYGSRRLYEYMHDNPSILVMPGSFVNDPYRIGKTNRFTSINTALQVDLTGQCASESIGSKQYSGTGGQADTVLGALRSRGGKSIMALHSTYRKRGKDGGEALCSKITAQLDRGSIVSLSRNDVDYVVTEYGYAYLRGLSVRERAEELIRIAHPDFRDRLREEAKMLRFL